MSSTSSSEKILLALGVGVVIGAGLGILFAPKKGADTRHQIGEGFDFCRDKVSDFIDQIKKRGCGCGCSEEGEAEKAK